uniref:neuroblastoma breakpoint family member 6-like n=1 Tax=Callithrix jacchus TaxID=9483 RepID=UPI00159F6369|nr:neuroblastoma breakpoint family member 6-like [Callithrix jacchus]
MAESAEHLSRERAEMNISEITQELRSQLAESQQQFQDLKEKFPGPPTDYCLAKQLKKSNLVLAPSVGMKNPPQLEDDALKGSAGNTQGRQVTGNIHASSVMKPKKMKRKLRFGKWIHWASCSGSRGTKHCQKDAKNERM